MPDATSGERIVADWSDSEDVRVTSALLRDLARRIDEDRSALDFANRALHDTLSAIKETLGYAGPVDGDALVAHAAELRQKRDALAEEVALDDKLLAERGRLLDALPCPRHGRECVPGAIERVDALRAALLATRDHEEPDGSCWCPREVPWHDPACLQVRAALGIPGRGRAVPYAEMAPETDDPHTGSDPEHRGTEPAP